MRVKSITKWLPHCSVVAAWMSGIVQRCLNEKQIHKLFWKCIMVSPRDDVLGWSGIGLIFTRSQEGTQLGQLTQTGQIKEVIHAVWLHARFWVRELARGRWIMAEECAGHQAVRESCSVYLLVLGILLISFIVVTICFLWCSVKLPLSWCSVKLPLSRPRILHRVLRRTPSHSPPHPSGGRGQQPRGYLLPVGAKPWQMRR